MVLSMIRPYRHPKTGVYWLRKVVPAPLRAALGRRELVQSLGSKDPKEVRAKAPAVIAHFEAVIAAARIGGSRPPERDIAGLCGEWYRTECAAWGADPSGFGDTDVYLSLLVDQIEDTEAADTGEHGRVKLAPRDLDEARALLIAHGYLADPDSIERMATALFPTKMALAHEIQRRQGGDWSPDPLLARFPALALKVAPEAPPQGITVGALIAAWGAERGTTGKALYDRVRTGKMLTDFVGHTEAPRVTADDVVGWKEARLAAGRSTKTVANDIGELRPIWTWGKVNRKLSFSENPFAGLAPRTKKTGRRVRGPYTEDEARRVLIAARSETAPSLRWLPWVLCFTGARLGEITQAVKEDVQRENGAGPWFVHLHAEGAGRTLKTPQSERMVPIHPALIAEGFLRHVQALPAGSPLCPDLRPDTFGTLKGNATKSHGRWVRHTVGITDKTKDPAHAWRHRFEDQARRAGVPQNVTDGLLGHLNTANESEGYGRGFRFMPDATAGWVRKMAAPLPAGVRPLRKQGAARPAVGASRRP